MFMKKGYYENTMYCVQIFYIQINLSLIPVLQFLSVLIYIYTLICNIFIKCYIAPSFDIIPMNVQDYHTFC